MTAVASRAPLASAPLGVLAADGPGECPPTTTWSSCVLGAADAGLAVGIGPGTTAQGLARLEPVARALVPADGDFTTIPAASLRKVLDSPQIAQADQAAQLNTFLTRRGALNLVVGPVPALQTAAARQTTATVATPTPAAAFELTGTAQAGELKLYTPIGTTLALLTWSRESALLRANGEVRSFDSLDALALQATGATIPIGSLFDWLGGSATQTEGWHADVTQLGSGRVTARRATPLPAAELKLLLDQ